MGCGSSTGSSTKITMVKTKLVSCDAFFDDVQKMIKEVYDLLDPIDDAKIELLECTGLASVECATVQHAVVGVVLALCCSLKGIDVMSAVKITMSDPYIEIDGSKAEGAAKEAIEHLKKYVKTLCSCKEKIEAFVEKAKAFADKAGELPEKAKDEITKEGKMGTMDKLRALKNVTTNCRQLAKIPALVMELKDTVMGSLQEIMDAGKEIEAKKDKMLECATKLMKEGKKTPKDCYLCSGDAIKCTPEDKKKHAAIVKKRAAAAKLKAKPAPMPVAAKKK